MKKHKEFLVNVVSKVANKKIYSGLDFSQLKPGQDSLDFDQIPGLKEAGWTHEDYLKNAPDDMSFTQQCMFIINKMKQHPSAWPFTEPVNPDEVKDYYKTIKTPIDI